MGCALHAGKTGIRRASETSASARYSLYGEVGSISSREEPVHIWPDPHAVCCGVQLAVLEARSKAWSRTVPAAVKGRSQSAPRGAPRHRQAPQRGAPAIAEGPEQVGSIVARTMDSAELDATLPSTIDLDISAELFLLKLCRERHLWLFLVLVGRCREPAAALALPAQTPAHWLTDQQ